MFSLRKTIIVVLLIAATALDFYAGMCVGEKVGRAECKKEMMDYTFDILMRKDSMMNKQMEKCQTLMDKVGTTHPALPVREGK